VCPGVGARSGRFVKFFQSRGIILVINGISVQDSGQFRINEFGPFGCDSGAYGVNGAGRGIQTPIFPLTRRGFVGLSYPGMELMLPPCPAGLKHRHFDGFDFGR
jgi:hypothetical protein